MQAGHLLIELRQGEKEWLTGTCQRIPRQVTRTARGRCHGTEGLIWTGLSLQWARHPCHASFSNFPGPCGAFRCAQWGGGLARWLGPNGRAAVAEH